MKLITRKMTLRNVFVRIIIIAIVISTSSCKQFIMLRYGIKKPKIETPESILAYSEKFGLDPNNVYVFKDTISYFQILRDSVFKKNALSTIFFNRSGYLIFDKKNNSCQWSGGAFLNHYVKDSVYSIDTTHQINSLFQKIIPLKSEEKHQGTEDYDLTVVSIWAKFIGKYNERLFCVSEVAQTRQDLNIRFVFLNVDMLKEWNLKKEQMLR
jgi:hypothetical protein